MGHVNEWNLQELTTALNKWKAQHDKAVASIVNESNNYRTVIRAASQIVTLGDKITEAQRNVDQFDDILRLQRMVDHLHTIMPDVWADVKINYFDDKGFWEADGRLLGRSSAKSSVMSMIEYGKKKGIDLSII